MAPSKQYKRVLLKLSGESLCGASSHGIKSAALSSIGAEIKLACDLGLQMGIVVGGGNIWRGEQDRGEAIGRVTADYMGMLATLINALAQEVQAGPPQDLRRVPVRRELSRRPP